MRVEMMVWSTSPLSIEVVVDVLPYQIACLWECWRGEWWMDEPSCEEIKVAVAQWEVWVKANYNFWLGEMLNVG